MDKINLTKNALPVYSKDSNADDDCFGSDKGNAPVIWMEVDPENDDSTKPYPTNAGGGTIVSMNLTPGQQGGVTLKEYYMSGPHTSTKPDVGNYIDFAARGGSGSKYQSKEGYADSVRTFDSTNSLKTHTEVSNEGFLRPGAGGISIEGGSGCETCRKKYANAQALWLLNNHMQVLAQYGFNQAFTGVAVLN